MYQVFRDKDSAVTYSKNNVGGKPIGKVQSGTALFEEDTLDLAGIRAKAWLLDNTEETVYVCDSGEVMKYMRNAGMDELTEKYYKYSAVYIAHIVYLATYIIFPASHAMSTIGIALLAGVIGLYHFLRKTKIANEVEGAFVCEIILIMVFILIPALQAASDKAS